MVATTKVFDIGDTVVCDLCNEDYTDSDAEGGITMGSYAICPECAPRIIRNAEETGELVVHCPAGILFKDWVLELRDGRNTIEITTF